jgi:hypothetical protein
MSVLNNRPLAINNFLKLHGNKPIRRIIVSRIPVSGKVQYLAELITLGQWSANMKKLNYEDVYHLFMIVELDDGILFKIEKNSRVDITLNNNKLGDTMINITDINNTLNDMFDNAEKLYGNERIYRYDPFKTNCQVLLIDLLTAINKITPELRTYIMQQASMLVENDLLKYLAKLGTDGIARARYTIEGGKKTKRKINKRKIVKKILK